jgi:DnaJ family protein C protein 7
MQDATNAIYADSELLQPYLLKAEALQEMERWGEALGVLEACINSEPSRRSDQQVLQKVAEAQFLVRKSQRPDLYKLLGVQGVGSVASEKEIRAAYKQQALKWHPDRFSEKGEAERKEAEEKFKELGDALELLTDEFKRKLWDQGHDAESIKQQVAMRDQQQQQR